MYEIKLKERLLIWFPVAFLPLSNLIAAWATHRALTLSPVWILGAVAEELFYRFFLLKTIFLPRMRPVSAILLVSILFAGMHLFNLRIGQPVDVTLVQIFGAFCFSIWAGAVTWRFTWLIPLVAHVLMNATAGAELMWAQVLVSAAVLADGLFLMKGEKT